MSFDMEYHTKLVMLVTDELETLRKEPIINHSLERELLIDGIKELKSQYKHALNYHRHEVKVEWLQDVLHLISCYDKEVSTLDRFVRTTLIEVI